MHFDKPYDSTDQERIVTEPSKRVAAPTRTAFERDRARVVHSASLRRLAAKTQVLGPQSDDFVRNRLTHSLEVAQVARDIAHPLGCHPDIVETAALAHDLGHPPFGHSGEAALDEITGDIGGFEGNAQTFRILTRLESKTLDQGASVGLNLTRATLDACTKYPWQRPASGGKFGVYQDDLPIFDWMRTAGAASALPVAQATARCIEAQIMDFGDDVAYSVHDLEDGIVAGHIDPLKLDHDAVWETVRDWYQPEACDAQLEEALRCLQALGSWPTTTYEGSRSALAALKNLTSDLIGIFAGEVHQATVAAHGPDPLVRYRGDLEIPQSTADQILVLKGIAAHYVMRTPARLELVARQRECIHELFEAVARGEEAYLEPAFAADFLAASDDAAKKRVLVDQVASLTDESCVRWHSELTQGS